MVGAVGVFGGSFNPPHIGHITAVKTAFEWLKLKKVIFIPSRIPPHKKLAISSPNAEIRAELLRSCLASEPWAEVSEIELNRDSVSYTYDTLRELFSIMPNEQFVLLVGTDMFKSLESWFNGEWILRNVSIAVFCRTQQDGEVIEQYAEKYKRLYNTIVDIVPNFAIEISSTKLRSLLSERKGREYTEKNEYAFIIKHGLYGAKPDYVWLRNQAYSMLKLKRIPHVQGTEKVACELAELYGENVDDARTAAILHDITKKLDMQQQLILCKKYGIMVDSLESSSEKLLHSKTGAYYSRDMFGISRRVFEAIKWHTTGKAAMSLLEKIIYIADYIEPTRDFEGVDKLRELAYTDINLAMLLGLKMSVLELEERNVPVHHRTFEALEYYENLSSGKVMEEQI